MESLDPPDALRRAADLLNKWESSKGTDAATLVNAFVEIATVHDAMFDLMAVHPVYAGVIAHRREQISNLKT